MPRLKQVILDHDETIVENTVDFYEAYCEALKEYRSSCIPIEEFMELLRRNMLSSKIPDGISHSEFWTVFRRKYKSRHSFPRRGLYQFFTTLRNYGVRFFIVSGREVHPLEIMIELERHGLAEFIDHVFTLHDLYTMGFNEEFLFDKSRLIEFLKNKYGGVEDGALVCIGDYITDYLSCRKAGGIFIGINTYVERNNELKKVGVEYTARDFYEVLNLLSSLGLLR